MDYITETEWDHFYNICIVQKTHTTPSHQTITGTLFYKQEPKLNISLEEFSTTNEKMDKYLALKRRESMLPDNVHQHAINKTLQNID